MSHSTIRRTIENYRCYTWRNINRRACNSTFVTTNPRDLKYRKNGVKLLMTREEFYQWCDQHKNSILTLARPSIDRIDPTKHYSLDNIQVLPFSENCRKAAISKKTPLLAICQKTGEQHYFASAQEAANLGYESHGIWRCLAGRRKHYKNMQWKKAIEVQKQS